MPIYVNNGATSYPKPAEVAEQVLAALTSMPFDPGRGLGSGPDTLTDCRQKLAQLINARDYKRVVLTPGATFSLNYAIQGISFGAHQHPHFVTTVLEHNSVLRPLYHLRDDFGAELSFVEFPDALTPAAFEAEIRPATIAIVITLCSNVNGATPDIERISEVCRKHGLTLIIDAAQGIGSIAMDVSRLTPKLLVAIAGHKGLFGPAGTGALYLGEGIGIGDLRPLLHGGTGVLSELETQPQDLPIRYECGTMNIPGFAGLAAGVDFVLSVGVDTVARHKQELITTLLDEVRDIDGISFYEPPNQDYRAGVLSFNLEGWDPEDAAYVLSSSFGVITRSGLHCAPLIHKQYGNTKGAVRISVGWFNTLDEMAEIARAIKQLATSAV